MYAALTYSTDSTDCTHATEPQPLHYAYALHTPSYPNHNPVQALRHHTCGQHDGEVPKPVCTIPSMCIECLVQCLQSLVHLVLTAAPLLRCTHQAGHGTGGVLCEQAEQHTDASQLILSGMGDTDRQGCCTMLSLQW